MKTFLRILLTILFLGCINGVRAQDSIQLKIESYILRNNMYVPLRITIENKSDSTIYIFKNRFFVVNERMGWGADFYVSDTLFPYINNLKLIKHKKQFLYVTKSGLFYTFRNRHQSINLAEIKPHTKVRYKSILAINGIIENLDPKKEYKIRIFYTTDNLLEISPGLNELNYTRRLTMEDFFNLRVSAKNIEKFRQCPEEDFILKDNFKPDRRH